MNNDADADEWEDRHIIGRMYWIECIEWEDKSIIGCIGLNVCMNVLNGRIDVSSDVLD